jgi:hypothetical protein
MWLHYDDFRDHAIVASKREWDHFNRLLLLLASDAEIQVARRWCGLHVSQVAALLAFASYTHLAARGGFLRDDLFAWTFPFGLVSMALAWFNRRQKIVQTRKTALEPFPSLTSPFCRAQR